MREASGLFARTSSAVICSHLILRHSKMCGCDKYVTPQTLFSMMRPMSVPDQAKHVWVATNRETRERLKLRVQPQGVHRDRTAVGIVRGVTNELVIDGQHRPSVEAVGIVGLQYLLRPVVELPITNQDAVAAGSEISAGLRREAVDHAGYTDLVVWTPPSLALE